MTGRGYHTLAKYPLAPLLLAQGIYVRRTVPKLPEASGPREGRAGQGPELSLLVLGDSAAAGVGVATQADALSGRIVAHLARHFIVSWRVLAKTGATSATTRARLTRRNLPPIDVAVISLGVNDMTTDRSIKAYLADLAAIVEQLRSAGGAKLIVVSGFPPVGQFPALPQPLRWYLGRACEAADRALEAFVATQARCHYLNLGPMDDPSMVASDGFHPGAPVYELWATRVAEIVRAMAPQLTANHRSVHP